VAQEILVFSESEADGDFAYHMEDVLEVYCQPYDPAVPRICMDEMGKNAGHQTNMRPNEASPGQVAREDYTYEKEGALTCSLLTSRSLASDCVIRDGTADRSATGRSSCRRSLKNSIPMPPRWSW